jgi:predicted porin
LEECFRWIFRDPVINSINTRRRTMHYRSKLALAVLSTLALPGLALAQATADKGTMKGVVSTVEWELYGHLYPEYTYVKQSGASTTADIQSTLGGTAGAALHSHWELDTTNSRVGLRAQRSMGSGITAIAQLEYTVNIDVTGANISARDSFLGLRGGFGTVKLGIMDTVFKNTGDTLGFMGYGSGNFVSNSNVLAKGAFGANSANSFHLRRANSVQYQSPEFGGFQAAAQYSPDEAEGALRADLWSVGATYQKAGLYLGVAYEIHNDFFGGSRNVSAALANPLTGAANSEDTAMRGTVGYKFGGTKIEGNYGTMKFSESGQASAGKFESYKHNSWSLSGEHTMGPVTVAIAYVSSAAGSCSRFGGVACSTSGLDGKMINLGARYSWPEASVFVLYGKLTNGASAQYNPSAQGDTIAPGVDDEQIAVGISFRF